MASASGIRAGRAYVELSADDSRLARGLRAAQARLQAFGASVRRIGTVLTGLGTAALAGLGLAARIFADTGSRLNDLSARTGVSVEALSALAYAAQQSGASLETVEAGLRTMQRVIGAAAAGSAAASEALARLGLSAQALAGLAPEQQFTAVAAALRAIPDPTQRAAAAMTVLGRSGGELLPLIADLDDLTGEARRLGLVVTSRQAQLADALGDAFDRVAAAARSVVNAVGEALAPVLIDLAQQLTQMLVGLRDWIAQNQGLVRSIAKIAAIVVGVGVGLVALGGIISGIAAVCGALATVVGVVTTALSALGTVLGALLTPIGLVVAAVAGLGAVLVTHSQAGQEAIGLLRDGFTTLGADATDAWHGIADALAAGDLGLAARVAWAALKLEWQRGITFLQEVWDALIATLASRMAEGWFAIRRLVASAVAAIAGLWDTVVTAIVTRWNQAVGAMAAKLARLLSLLGLADQGIDLRIEAGVTQRNAALEERRQGRANARAQDLTGLDTERDQTLAAIDEEAQQRFQEREQAVTAARAELDAALAAARTQRAAVTARTQEPADANAPTITTPNLAGLQAALDRVPDAVSAAAAKLDVSGGFNAAAVAQLGVGDTAGERTAKATEETATNTKRLLTALEDQGLVFG